MTFDETFELFIKGRIVIGWGFQQPLPVKLPNGSLAFPCGYYTIFDNGYRLIISGDTIGSTAIQEAIILDTEGIPIAQDSEDLREV